jgi:deoxycytidylate deaminase
MIKRKHIPRKQFVLTATTFDKKGKVIAHGTNNYNKSHPLQKHFSLLAGESEKKCVLHAELSAILQSRGKVIESIFVQRFAADGTYALAKPCPSCQQAIKAFGIKKVMFTTPNGIEQYTIKD